MRKIKIIDWGKSLIKARYCECDGDGFDPFSNDGRCHICRGKLVGSYQIFKKSGGMTAFDEIEISLVKEDLHWSISDSGYFHLDWAGSNFFIEMLEDGRFHLVTRNEKINTTEKWLATDDDIEILMKKTAYYISKVLM